jgi:iron complex transport system substrate-binding protein
VELFHSNHHWPKLRLLGWLSLLLGLLTACEGNDERRRLVEDAPSIAQHLEDQVGRELTLSNKPTRIISLAPNITEILFAIGAEDKLVARSQACDYPAEVDRYPTVTTYPELDLEQLKALDPDLIITTDEIFTPEDLALLDKLQLPIYLQRYDSLADVYRGMRELGEVLDVADQANRVADSLMALEQRVLDSTANAVHYRTTVLISNDPLKVVGGQGYLNQLIVNAGGLNVFADVQQPYPTTTVEQLLKAEPEYLILPSKQQGVYANLLEQYPALYNTPADVYDQVYVIDPDLLYRPGPRMLQGLLQLTHVLHSKLNPQFFIDAAPQP